MDMSGVYIMKKEIEFRNAKLTGRESVTLMKGEGNGSNERKSEIQCCIDPG
jgi:hypothetical protein